MQQRFRGTCNSVIIQDVALKTNHLNKLFMF